MGPVHSAGELSKKEDEKLKMSTNGLSRFRNSAGKTAIQRDKDQGLPPCGLYKTTGPIQIDESRIKEGLLVSFHNHSDQGPPIILLPEKNVHNRWTFQNRGYLIKDKSLMHSLKPLKAEGLYRVRESFQPNNTQLVSKNALVQLGYTAKAEPIIFLPQPVSEENAFSFPAKGLKIPDPIYKLLDPIDTRGLLTPKKELLPEEKQKRLN